MDGDHGKSAHDGIGEMSKKKKKIADEDVRVPVHNVYLLL